MSEIPRKGDLTQGPILRGLVLFSMPAPLSNLLQTLGGTINSIWVGQLLGADALAATANGNIVTFMSFAAVFGFSMATTVKVGQHFGARDPDAARRVFGTGIGFCMALSVAVSLAGLVGGTIGALWLSLSLRQLRGAGADLVALCQRWLAQGVGGLKQGSAQYASSWRGV